jgi:sister chromatid cohesion protein PDS5
MCFELVESQEIFCSIFNLIFKIVNDEHSEKVKTFMRKILVPLLSESDSISNEFLDIILINNVEPNKTQKKNAYNLAKDLIKKTTDSLMMYIQSFLNKALMQDKPDKLYQISKRIYELNVIAPSLLLPVLAIRIKCVQSTMHFLTNHANFRPEIIGVLNGRQYDADESVRYVVVSSLTGSRSKSSTASITPRSNSNCSSNDFSSPISFPTRSAPATR